MLRNKTRACAFVATVVVAIGIVGCYRAELPVTFERNLVHAYKYELTEGLPMQQVTRDTSWALEQLFGTPDDPKIPEFTDEQINEIVKDVVDLDKLKLVAGPIPEEGSDAIGGVYRQHCATCHGDAGNGRGPAGAILNPYPRDYRMGVFKFKSTSRDAKPTKEDLAKLIRHGIPGSGMTKIPGVSDKDQLVDALVDYVIYLSWRGEVERQTIDAAMFDLDLEAGERVIRPESADLASSELEGLTDEEVEQVDAVVEKLNTAMIAEVRSKLQSAQPDLQDEELDELAEEEFEYLPISDQESMVERILPTVASASEQALFLRQQEIERQELYRENWSYIEESVVGVAEAWLEAEDNVTEIVDTGDIPVPADRSEFDAMMKGPQAEALAASVQRGHELFLSESVGCAKCHGNEGKGDGQTADYDDWTKDWTINVGLDPLKKEALMPLMARGALPPLNIKPRNFSEGIFRGGSDPESLFRRITNGIAGTPMPAAPVIEGQFGKQDIWHIINYIRSLDATETSTEAAPSTDVGPEAKASAGTATKELIAG